MNRRVGGYDLRYTDVRGRFVYGTLTYALKVKANVAGIAMRWLPLPTCPGKRRSRVREATVDSVSRNLIDQQE